MIVENYDGIILAVAHKEFKEIEDKIRQYKSTNTQITNNQVIYDIKGFFDKFLVDGRL